MARRSTFNVRIDIAPTSDLATQLSRLTPAKYREVLVGAINTTADSAYTLSRKTMLGGINLTDDYVQQRMSVEHASANSLQATLTAFGGKEFTTSLSHYGAMQEVQPAQHSGRSKGDPGRGIPAGSKAAGITVEVTRGSPAALPHGFTVVAKNGKQLVLARDKSGTAKARSGPAVYQLFRVASAKIEDQVVGDLQREVLDAVEYQFLKEMQ